jgi:hypothetical protein
VTNSDKKRISAKQVLSDIRSGTDAVTLKNKYGLSDKSLEKVFRKLVEAGALAESERPPAESVPAQSPDTGPQAPECRCPVCGRINEPGVTECPVCGVVLAKLFARQTQGERIPDAAPTVGPTVGPRGRKAWATVMVSVAGFALIGGAVLICSWLRAPEEPSTVAWDVRNPRSHDVRKPIDTRERSTEDEPNTVTLSPEEQGETPSESDLSPLIPLPPQTVPERPLPTVKTEPPPGEIDPPPAEIIPSPTEIIPPAEKPSPPPKSPSYATGVLRYFRFNDFAAEVVEASNRYPVVIQFHSDT